MMWTNISRAPKKQALPYCKSPQIQNMVTGVMAPKIPKAISGILHTRFVVRNRNGRSSEEAGDGCFETREVIMLVNRSAPSATVVPILVYEDVAKAIDWLCKSFGFTERLRVAGPGDSVVHAQLVIAEGAVMLGRQGGEFRPP